MSPGLPIPRLHVNATRPSRTLARVAVIGEVDLATANQLRDRLFVVLHDQAPAVVDVDLAGVSFLDCAGISVLVAVRNHALDAGQQVYLSRPASKIRRLLEITGLFDLFTAPMSEPSHPPLESKIPTNHVEVDAGELAFPTRRP